MCLACGDSLGYALKVMSLAFRVALFLGMLGALVVVPTVASADVWNPFDGVPEQPSLFTEVRNLLRGLIEQIEELAGV